MDKVWALIKWKLSGSRVGGNKFRFDRAIRRGIESILWLNQLNWICGAEEDTSWRHNNTSGCS